MATTEIVAVRDAWPLIHLDELGQLTLLNDFKELLVPQTVLELKHRPALALVELFNLEVISEPPHSLPIYRNWRMNWRCTRANALRSPC
jgi:hypothetical protein